MAAKDFLSELEKEQVLQAIKEAELNTSGEIRLHIESRLKGDALDRAAYIFEKLAMHKTALRNGVLFYIATESRQFSILGDAGINQKVGDDFWKEVRELMAGHFSKQEFAQGLVAGILLAGEKLKQHFPYQEDDVNELSDEISYGS